ncbi:aldo/keto reductase [Coraliomargarita parva]|uniref:aldo/keto reductase n=1 Tax=Coraliomargarita parva TaxID=3014050 RepID=UPI0022B35695|nr:aldo/keto reductase [Coraliomargarita parva]
MQYTNLGHTDIKTSTLVLGTWVIGGSDWGGSDESESIEAIHASIDQGINFIDTAPIYGTGESERVVGKAIAGKRDQLVIASKVGLRWDHEEGEFNFEAEDGTKIYKNLKADSIRHEVEQSLKRLGTDYIDLLQTHWPDATTGIDETMETLLALKKEGKVRAIGACNLTTDLLQQYLDAGPLDTIQEKYSMVDRELEADLFPMANAQGMSILAYSPLGMGLLTGKVGPERKFGADDIRSWSPRFTVECRQQVAALLEQFEPIRAKYEVSLAQLVIAWTVHQPVISHVLCGARNLKQAEENAIGGNLEISTEDVSAMTAILEAANLQLPHPFKGD